MPEISKVDAGGILLSTLYEDPRSIAHISEGSDIMLVGLGDRCSVDGYTIPMDSNPIYLAQARKRHLTLVDLPGLRSRNGDRNLEGVIELFRRADKAKDLSHIDAIEGDIMSPISWKEVYCSEGDPHPHNGGHKHDLLIDHNSWRWILPSTIGMFDKLLGVTRETRFGRLISRYLQLASAAYIFFQDDDLHFIENAASSLPAGTEATIMQNINDSYHITHPGLLDMLYMKGKEHFMAPTYQCSRMLWIRQP
jgi:hypothetical protein